MRRTFGIVLAALLIVACQGRELPDLHAVATDTRETKILDLAMKRALIDRKIPDHGLLADPRKVILSDRNLPADWEPRLAGIEILVMTEAEIETRASRDGDFLFLYVSELSFPDSGTANIRMHSMWARAKDSNVVYLSGGGFAVIYQKTGDTWKEVSSASWIS
ncbi:MAG: hypothetical protein O6844_06225 [Gammaproteobacteria bacterium]|nr:hypothetical protein [Gammaproteobacteria bacterium]MCZ6827868.1 hypothetical protein [Gammaproteobacteria bacterium]MCZ6911255.1 hypothetical protein [Pseudomonadota bacterium]